MFKGLCKQIVDIIREKGDGLSYKIESDIIQSVKSIHSTLLDFKKKYIDNNIIPALPRDFDVNLFNTFRSYIEDRIVTMDNHLDDRGYLSETIKTNAGGQSFFSTTKPSYIRGQHFHMRKLERFCVLRGEAEINLRKLGDDKIITYKVSVIRLSILIYLFSILIILHHMMMRK